MSPAVKPAPKKKPTRLKRECTASFHVDLFAVLQATAEYDGVPTSQLIEALVARGLDRRARAGQLPNGLKVKSIYLDT
jgi:hypothetical protein